MERTGLKGPRLILSLEQIIFSWRHSYCTSSFESRRLSVLCQTWRLKTAVFSGFVAMLRLHACQKCDQTRVLCFDGYFDLGLGLVFNSMLLAVCISWKFSYLIHCVLAYFCSKCLPLQATDAPTAVRRDVLLYRSYLAQVGPGNESVNYMYSAWWWNAVNRTWL